MYTKASELGLPAMFVDLRHEITHGQMPSLSVLREATEGALEWLRKDYWYKILTHQAVDMDQLGDVDISLDKKAPVENNGEESFEIESEAWEVYEGALTQRMGCIA